MMISTSDKMRETSSKDFMKVVKMKTKIDFRINMEKMLIITTSIKIRLMTASTKTEDALTLFALLFS